MKKFVTLLLTLFIATCVYAQSAEVITSILESEEVTYGQICYLSAVRQGLVAEDSSYDDAFGTLVQRGDVSADVSCSDVINLQNLSRIYTKIWDACDGGLMYRITKGSARYSFKLLKADGILTDKADPMDKVSGFEALNILSSCMMEYGSDEECMDMDIE